MKIKAIVFDWGDTVMRDLPFKGAMKDWPFVAIIPDVKDAILKLRNDYIIILASNAGDSTSEDIITALDRVGLKDLFHHVFSSKDLGVEKPNVQFFELIKEQLEIKPEELIMIGNNCQKDIKGAKKAGWNTIWFNENEAQTTECQEADMSLFFMGALDELIQKIDNDE